MKKPRAERSRPRHPRPLDRAITVFVFSAKKKAVLRLVEEQVLLLRYAESNPRIVGFSFPGSKLAVQIAGKAETVQLAMTVEFDDGVTGAATYLGKSEVGRGLVEALRERATALPMRLEILHSETFTNNIPFYSTWTQLLRYLHPMVDQARLPVTQAVAKHLERPQRIPIHAIARALRLEPQEALEAVAFLAHRGTVLIDTERGCFDLATNAWRLP